MKIIGIIPNLARDKKLHTTKKLISRLKEKDLSVYVSKQIASYLQDEAIGIEEEELYKECDVIIAIGGDGTILSIAQNASLSDVPILGINLGRLGFLADIEIDDIDDLIEKLLNEDYTIEERMMLQAKVTKPDEKEEIFYAVNDVTVTRGSFSRMEDFEIYSNNELVDIYPADGILIATPTGSTAYNLSAGGPIIVPTAKALIVTPICPHTIYSRTIIMSHLDVIHIKTCNYEGTAMQLCVDGKPKVDITPKHDVEVTQSPYVLKLVKTSHLSFFEILRKKIVERRK